MKKETKTETTRVKKRFTFDLTANDTVDRAKEAANTREQIQTFEDELSTCSKELKSKIKLEQLKMRNLLRTIKLGKEEREVECDEVKDYTKLTVKYFFGGKEMSTREMTESERQTSMKFNGTSKVGTKAKRDDVKSVMREETSKKTKRDASTSLRVVQQ